MTPATPLGATVVVVDDQTSVRTILARAMEGQGYTAIALASAQDCLEYCLRNTPDAVLLDTVMPHMDGFTCCELLRATLGEECPPILMVTALNDRDSVDRAFEVGASDFITKPIHWPVLYNRLASLIRSYWNALKLQREIARTQNLTRELAAANQDLELKVIERAGELQEVLTFESLLKRITDRVRETLDEAYILQTVVEELATCLRLSSASVGLLQPQGNAYTIRYECSLSLPSCEGQAVEAIDHPDGWLCFEQGLSVYHMWLHPLRGRVVALGCPLHDEDGQLLGILNLMRPPLGTFSKLEIRLAEQVANQCAIAIRQARLYEAAQIKITELQRLAELKDDFLSTVSHELRTPLTSMRMSLQMLKHASTLEKRQRYQAMLEYECEREISLVEDLLLMRDLTARNDCEDTQRLELGQMLVAIVESKSEMARSRNLDVVFEEASRHFWVQLNERYLTRMLAELLDNACKHTRRSGTIAIHLFEHAEDRNCVTIGIRNSGTVPQSELQHLFDTFHRIPQPDRWQTSGTGLGLALVKQIVEQLDGAISVSSAEDWVQFDLYLPLSQEHPSHDHPEILTGACSGEAARVKPMAVRC